jgi:hypothetical protein
MEIRKIATGVKIVVIISEAEEKDFKLLVKKRFSFSWKLFKNSSAIYKLEIAGENDILVVIGLIDVPEEKRIEIKLLASSSENIGRGKIYEGIAGCLIAFACRLAVTKYGAEACVSLVPKTKLVKHYMEEYHMLDAGWQLYLEGKWLHNLLKKYAK